MDFRLLKEKTQAVLASLDHHYLNDLPVFQDQNPSAENLAAYIFAELSRQIDAGPLRLSSVSVWESETSQAIYQGPIHD